MINNWKYKDLLDVDNLTSQEIMHLMATATSFAEINTRSVKKVPTLKGKSIILFFAEPSTRTKTSFDIAGKRMSADTFGLATSGSSIVKGESLKDTALTLEAMNPDAIVIRHGSSGAAQFVAERVECSVINGGDGFHAHPTQALLDCYSISKAWNNEFAGKTLLILGDIAHSRVARSNILLFNTLGVRVRVCAPKTLLPAAINNWPVEVYTDLNKAAEGVDAIMTLRMQLERQQAGLLPDLNEYSRLYCLSDKHLASAAKDVKLMHPGPVNRGLEISSNLVDDNRSLVLDQVNAGVAVRMAVFYLLINRKAPNTLIQKEDI